MKFIAREGNNQFPVEVTRHGAGYRVCIGDRCMDADLVEMGRYVRSLRLEDGTQFSLVHHREGTIHEISFGAATVRVELVDPLAARRKRRDDEISGGGMITALMPGRVVRIFVEAGAEVNQGDGLLILEAMKMENEVLAPRSGKVAVIHVKSGQTVESGAPLVEIEGS